MSERGLPMTETMGVGSGVWAFITAFGGKLRTARPRTRLRLSPANLLQGRRHSATSFFHA